MRRLPAARLESEWAWSASNDELCDSIEQITHLPVKESPLLGNALYDALRKHRGELGSCLVTRISDTAWMDEPLCPRVVGRIQVGDLAFFLLSGFDYFEWDDVLPSDWRSAHSAGGVSAYYAWVERPGNRARLQESARAWIATHSVVFPEPPMTIAEAMRERDARASERDYQAAIGLTELLMRSDGEPRERLRLPALQLAWLDAAGVEPPAGFSASEPLAMLIQTAQVAHRASEPESRALENEAATLLEDVYREGRAGVSPNEQLANCWKRVRESHAEPMTCLTIHDPARS